MLAVRCVRDCEEFESLAPAWNDLVRHTTLPHAVFARHEWARAWFDAFGAGSLPHVLVATDHGTLRGILPLRMVRARFAGWPVSRLETMANGHAPRADLLAAAGFEKDVLGAFALHLRETDDDWDVAMLSEVVVGSPLLRLHDLFPSSARLLQPQRRPPYIALNGDWDGFQGSLSRNFRRMLHNNKNRIARAGRVELELLETPDTLVAGLADMFRISAQSWQGVARSAIGSCDSTVRFYSGIVRAFAPEGSMRLWFLRLDGRRVAFELHMHCGDVEYGLKTGYVRDYAPLGVGTFLDQRIVEHLFTEGATHEYDLLGDSDPYKLRWTGRSRDVVRVSLFRAHAQSQVLSAWDRTLKPRLRLCRDWICERVGPVLGRGAIAATTVGLLFANGDLV